MLDHCVAVKRLRMAISAVHLHSVHHALQKLQALSLLGPRGIMVSEIKAISNHAVHKPPLSLLRELDGTFPVQYTFILPQPRWDD